MVVNLNHMTKNTWTIIGIVAILLIGMVAGWQLIKVFTPAPPQIKHDTIRTPFDTTAFISKLNLKPKIITSYKDTGSIKWKDNIILIPYYKATRADTIRDYTAYHNTVWNKDTLTNDQNLFYEATHGITQNRLISFEGRYFWKHPATTVNNNPVLQPTNKLLLGIGVASDFVSRIGVSGGIDYQNKKDALYGLKITFIPNEKPIFELHHSIKIKF